MAVKINFKEFLRRARTRWGNQFVYKEPENFSFSNGVVEIFCSEKGHGWFVKKPSLHVNDTPTKKAQGCPFCFLEDNRIAKMKPFAQFVKDAQKIHGDKFEYLKCTYFGAKQYTAVICQKHGIFSQTPDAHINGKQGCAECANEKTGILSRRRGLLNAQARLAELTAGKIKILEETYIQQRKEAQFVCEEHGEYTRVVINALTSVYPCKDCSEGAAFNQTLSKEQIYNKISVKHGNFKILSILGVGKHATVRVKCFDCDRGEYDTSVDYATRSDVLCGNCRRIASEPYRRQMASRKVENSLLARTEKWIARYHEIWGDRYDYSELNYKSAREKVKVLCRELNHPPFYPTAHAHLTKGCRLCANEELKGRYSLRYFELFPKAKEKPGILYYLKCEYREQFFYKIGITTKDVKTRHSMLNSIDGLAWEVLEVKSMTLHLAFQKEQQVQISHGDKYRLELPFDDETTRKIRIGPSECFSVALDAKTVEWLFSYTRPPELT